MKQTFKFDEEMLRFELKNAVQNCMPSADTQLHLQEKLNAADAKSQTFRKLHHFSPKAVLIAATLCILGVSGTVFAGGQIIGNYMYSDAFHNYSHYEDLAKAEEKAGFQTSLPERFSTGYEFDGITMTHSGTIDENGNHSAQRLGIDAEYKNADDARLLIQVEEEPLRQEDKENATAVAELSDGTLVYYSEDTYLNVPYDYQPTDEELSRDEEDPHFFIAVGSDQIETTEASFAVLEIDGITYVMQSPGQAASKADMLRMAEELIS